VFKVIRSNIETAITPPRIAEIVFQFGTEFHHVTGDTLQMFKVTVSAAKTLYGNG